jgi:hypothetical protein
MSSWDAQNERCVLHSFDEFHLKFQWYPAEVTTTIVFGGQEHSMYWCKKVIYKKKKKRLVPGSGPVLRKPFMISSGIWGYDPRRKMLCQPLPRLGRHWLGSRDHAMTGLGQRIPHTSQMLFLYCEMFTQSVFSTNHLDPKDALSASKRRGWIILKPHNFNSHTSWKQCRTYD